MLWNKTTVRFETKPANKNKVSNIIESPTNHILLSDTYLVHK